MRARDQRERSVHGHRRSGLDGAGASAAARAAPAVEAHAREGRSRQRDGGSGPGAHPRPGADFNFIRFPQLTSAGQGVEEVSADLLAMFHDTPAARKLLAYLTTPQAQQAWISRPASGALSANRQVPLSAYPDPAARALARNLTHAASIHFDASNSMPQTMASAFNNAVLQYLDSPAQLNVILHGLDQVRRAAYQQAAA